MLYLLLVLGASVGFIILAFALFVLLDSFRDWIVGLGFDLSSKLYTLGKRIKARKRFNIPSVSGSKVPDGTIDARKISSVSINAGQILVSPKLPMDITTRPTDWASDYSKEPLKGSDKVRIIKASEIEAVSMNSHFSTLRRDLLGMDDHIREALRQTYIRRQKEQQEKDGGSAA